MERAALARLALHPDRSAHHVHKSRADRQSQPRAAVRSGHGAIGLRERLEDYFCFSVGMPTPVSFTTKCKQAIAGVVAIPAATLTNDLAVFRELDGVADQIDEHLAHAAGVADDGVGNVRLDVVDQFQPFWRARTPKRLQGFAQAFAESQSGLDSSSSLPASILEKSRMSLMTVSRDSADICTMPRLFALLGSEFGIQDQFRHARECRSWACESRGSCWPGTRSWRGWRPPPPPWPCFISTSACFRSVMSLLTPMTRCAVPVGTAPYCPVGLDIANLVRTATPHETRYGILLSQPISGLERRRGRLGMSSG